MVPALTSRNDPGTRAAAERARRHARPARAVRFGGASSVVERLRETDVNTLTPLAALQLLAELAERSRDAERVPAAGRISRRYIAMMANFVRWHSLGSSRRWCSWMHGSVSPKKVAKVFQAGRAAPDETPRMLNEDLPFHILRRCMRERCRATSLCDCTSISMGQVTPDSTRIEESSGYAGSTRRP
jgi:hypothetical protein